jgi:hypothetical protein
MMSQRLSEGIQHKLMLKLLEFSYSIEYKKGVDNVVPDALSRKDAQILAISSIVPSWVSDIEQSYQNDPHFKAILEQTVVNDQTVPHYTVHTGILRYKSKICIRAYSDLRTKILSSLHSSPISDHSGIRATYQRIKRLFYWPKLKLYVETFVSQCPVCQRAKAENCQYPGLLSPLHIPDLAWSFISMDFIEGSPKSSNKNVILVVVDRLTKYAHFIALAHPFTAQSVAQLFIDNVFKLHGPLVSSD